jgi:sulfate adenylyltransferase large subunit
MAILTESVFSVEDFLAVERNKDLLRFSTAGSVDDGKSTLIGRLLYDTQSVYEDQVRSIEGKGTTAPGQIDFALLTDGLRAEREQGITIDVAYRYFATPRRKFIIADTPGHEQYTRNMATGASTASAAVVLVDAGKGVLPQSRRHAYIASLLRVSHVIVAVNKMDLVDYDEARFAALVADFRQVLERIERETGNPVDASFVPVSALIGDNIVHPSAAMPWYNGPSLLDLLESLPATEGARDAAFRLPVQRVLRPDHTFRGFAGQIASGVVRVGDAVTVQPSGHAAKVARIVTYDGDLDQAVAPQSITLVLDRELDISRGDLIAEQSAPARVTDRIEASLVWMDQQRLETNRRYLIKHLSHTAPAFVTAIHYRADIATLNREPAQALELNDIGGVCLQLLRPIALDLYKENRSTGAFILIDPSTNGTVAAGMITAASAPSSAERQAYAIGPVAAAEREARWGHRGALLEVSAPADLIDDIERSLLSVGAVAVRLDPDNNEFLLHPSLLEIITGTLIQSGVLALVARVADADQSIARIEGKQQSLDPGDPGQAIAAIHRLLNTTQVFISPERAGL